MSSPIQPLKVIADTMTLGTTGIIDFNKGGRFNVPFSSAQGRTAAKAMANGPTLGYFRKDVDNEFDKPFHRTGAGIAGAVAGAIVGGAAGGAVAGGGGAAASGGAAAGSGAAAGGTTFGVANATLGTAAGAYAGYAGVNQMNQMDQAKQEKKAIQALEEQTKRNAPPALPSLTTGDSLRRRRSFTTLLTSPYGVTEQADVQRPTLLGGRRTLLG